MYNFTVMHENTPVADVSVSDDHKKVKIEKLVPAISEKKQYTVAMNVISAHINQNV